MRSQRGKKPLAVPTSRSTAWTASSGKACQSPSLLALPCLPRALPLNPLLHPSSGIWRAVTFPAQPSVNVPPPLPTLPLQPLMMTSRGRVQFLWGPRKVKTQCMPRIALSQPVPTCPRLIHFCLRDLPLFPAHFSCLLISRFLPGIPSPDLPRGRGGNQCRLSAQIRRQQCCLGRGHLLGRSQWWEAP